MRVQCYATKVIDYIFYLSTNTAVICSVPNSSSSEVTYQPTDDISQHVNSPINQFSSNHAEGGASNALNDQAFSLRSSGCVSDNIHRTISSKPKVTGVAKSHKIEQEQLRTSKKQHLNKPSRVHHKFILPSQPVVMPRSAQMFDDIEEEFTGLEFGSGPLSPQTTVGETLSPTVDSR